MKKFFWKDKTGRGFTNQLTSDNILSMEDEFDWNDQSLHEFANEASEGDTWEDSSDMYTCIEE